MAGRERDNEQEAHTQWMTEHQIDRQTDRQINIRSDSKHQIMNLSVCKHQCIRNAIDIFPIDKLYPFVRMATYSLSFCLCTSAISKALKLLLILPFLHGVYALFRIFRLLVHVVLFRFRARPLLQFYFLLLSKGQVHP